MPLTLDSTTRRALKKQAHHLKPIVQTGALGMRPAVVAEIDRALFDHELVKIKLASDDKTERRAEIRRLCDELGAVCVQRIGRTATIYRPRPDD